MEEKKFVLVAATDQLGPGITPGFFLDVRKQCVTKKCRMNTNIRVCCTHSKGIFNTDPVVGF